MRTIALKSSLSCLSSLNTSYLIHFTSSSMATLSRGTCLPTSPLLRKPIKFLQSSVPRSHSLHQLLCVFNETLVKQYQHKECHHDGGRDPREHAGPNCKTLHFTLRITVQFYELSTYPLFKGNGSLARKSSFRESRLSLFRSHWQATKDGKVLPGEIHQVGQLILIFWAGFWLVP